MKNFFLSVIGVVIIGVLAGYGLSWFVQDHDKVEQQVAPVIVAQLPPRLVQLYFASPDGTALAVESREIPGCNDEAMCIKELLEALVAGPEQEAVAVLPKETQILSVGVENDLVRVDFSRHLSDFHPGGNLSELLTIYSLIDTLNENFSYLRQLQILIEGDVRQTLKGHARVDQPVTVDFALVQGPLPVRSEEKGDLSVEQLIDKALN